MAIDNPYPALLGPSKDERAENLSKASIAISAGAFLLSALWRPSSGSTVIQSGSSSAAPSGAAGGDLSGTYPDPSVALVGGVAAADVAAQLPSADEKDALAGTDGTPSAINPYVTDSDPRLTASAPVISNRDPNGADTQTVGTVWWNTTDGRAWRSQASGVWILETLPVSASALVLSGLVLAGPVTGAADVPTMRQLSSTDIPALTKRYFDDGRNGAGPLGFTGAAIGDTVISVMAYLTATGAAYTAGDPMSEFEPIITAGGAIEQIGATDFSAYKMLILLQAAPQ